MIALLIFFLLHLRIKHMTTRFPACKHTYTVKAGDHSLLLLLWYMLLLHLVAFVYLEDGGNPGGRFQR